MAKGFTVKATPPQVSKPPEWDYEKAKEMVRGKSVVFVYRDVEFHIHF